MSGSWDGGKRVAGAAALAVERVNANEALLPGRRLEYGSADSGCSAQQGLAAMGELLGGASTVDAVIGPACSEACEVSSYLSGGQGIPQISWGCTAVSLSNKEKYRLVRPLSVVVVCEFKPGYMLWFELCKFGCCAVLSHSGACHKQRASADCIHGAEQLEKDRHPFFDR